MTCSHVHVNSAKETETPPPDIKDEKKAEKKESLRKSEKSSKGYLVMYNMFCFYMFLPCSFWSVILLFSIVFYKTIPGETWSVPRGHLAEAPPPLNLDAACAVAGKAAPVAPGLCGGAPPHAPAEGDVAFVRGVSMDGVRMFLNFMQQAGYPPPPRPPSHGHSSSYFWFELIFRSAAFDFSKF